MRGSATKPSSGLARPARWGPSQRGAIPMVREPPKAVFFKLEAKDQETVCVIFHFTNTKVRSPAVGHLLPAMCAHQETLLLQGQTTRACGQPTASDSPAHCLRNQGAPLSLGHIKVLASRGGWSTLGCDSPGHRSICQLHKQNFGNIETATPVQINKN